MLDSRKSSLIPGLPCPIQTLKASLKCTLSLEKLSLRKEEISPNSAIMSTGLTFQVSHFKAHKKTGQTSALRIAIMKLSRDRA